ncbi:MAG TPA: cupredoxin domain-containing protein [Dissulfurispiraceae bacterium]|nr:cupredoxin domain-containing protein [Dissulfurispiraceae bacterium]
MTSNFIRLLFVMFIAIFALTACAGLQQQVTVGTAEGEKKIAIQADSFKFTPNNIRAYQGEEISITITNISNAGHNFTINDPKGQLVKSVELPSKQTAEIKITVTDAGEYLFYCDKPLHSSFGMKGRIEAVRK